MLACSLVRVAALFGPARVCVGCELLGPCEVSEALGEFERGIFGWSFSAHGFRVELATLCLLAKIETEIDERLVGRGLISTGQARHRAAQLAVEYLVEKTGAVLVVFSVRRGGHGTSGVVKMVDEGLKVFVSVLLLVASQALLL